MTKVAPGIYRDDHGGLHVDVPELLTAHGYADTPENRRLLARVALEQIRRAFGIAVTVTTDPIQED